MTLLFFAYLFSISFLSLINLSLSSTGLGNRQAFSEIDDSFSSSSSNSTFGNFYNYWVETDSGFDLTRGNVTGSRTLQVSGGKNIAFQPSKSAMVIVDMQNFFLNPDYINHPAGLAAVQPTIDAVTAFRAAGVKIVWLQWGVSDADILDMPPNFLYSFTDASGLPNTTFGSPMGVINNTDWGFKLKRDQFNSQQYGPLFSLAQSGISAGTDLYFPKNRLSGLWGARGSTPLDWWLMGNEMTTLFLSGVNIDQCVFGTFVDAVYKGYDAILIQDASATSSPGYATEMVLYNAALDGFVLNSTDIVSGLA